MSANEQQRATAKEWKWHHTHRWIWIAFLVELGIILVFIEPITSK